MRVNLRALPPRGDSEQQLECFGWLQWLLDGSRSICGLGEDYRRMHFPAILMSAWFMALLVNTMWAVICGGGLSLALCAGQC